MSLVACTNEKIVCNMKKPPEPKLKKSESAEVYIYLDGTSSMKGFAEIPFSKYYTLLNNLESAVNSSFSKSVDLHYFKFGAKVEEISRDEYKKALNSDFYGKYERRGHNITNIDMVLTYIDSMIGNDNIHIVITDLFQNNADIDKVMAILKRLKNKGVYTTIVAQRSEFKGKVYDVSEYKYTFDYQGQRPFYMLILSKNPLNIITVINKLKELDKNWNSHILLFGDTLYSNNPSVEFSKLKRAYKLSEESLKIKDNAHLELNLKINPLPFAAYTPDSVYVQSIDCKTMSPISTLKVSKEFASEDEIGLSINVKSMKHPLVLLKFSVLSSKKLPQWIEDFDMDISQIRNWLEKPENFPGNTTYNFKKFMTLVFNLYEPYFGQTYILMKK